MCRTAPGETPGTKTTRNPPRMSHRSTCIAEQQHSSVSPQMVESFNLMAISPHSRFVSQAARALKSAYTLFDESGDGGVDAQEFGNTLTKLFGWRPTRFEALSPLPRHASECILCEISRENKMRYLPGPVDPQKVKNKKSCAGYGPNKSEKKQCG